MIKGAIDNLGIKENGIEIFGWAYHIEGDTISSVDHLAVTGNVNFEYQVYSREDFANNCCCAFILKLRNTEDLILIYLGKESIIATKGEESNRLEIWDQIRYKFTSVFIAEYIKDFPKAELEKIAASLIGKLKEDSSHSENDDKNIIKTTPLLANEGFISYDYSAIIGKNGYIFLFAGNNNVYSLYNENVDDSKKNSWVHLVQSRKKICTNYNCSFYQIIFPEKQSILTDYYPYEITPPSPLYLSITTPLKHESSYIDTYTRLLSVYKEKGLVPFRKVDSHLSIHGVYESLCHILESMGLSINIEFPILMEKLLPGDLGKNLGYGNIYEKNLIPMADTWLFGQIKPVLTHSKPLVKGHDDDIMIWSNQDYLIDKSIIVFGDSYFESGAGFFDLSYWFSRIFKKTIFHRTPDFHEPMLETYKPDIVICQTCERLLPFLPSY